MRKDECRILAISMISVMMIVSMFQFTDGGCSGASSGCHIWVGSVDLSGEADTITVHIAVLDDPDGLSEGTVCIEGIGYVVKDDGLRAYAPITGVADRTITSGSTYAELTFTLPSEQNVHLVYAVYTPNGGDGIQSMAVYPIGA